MRHLVLNNIGIIGAGRIGKVHMKSITYSVPGAKVLGPFSVGDNARIAAGAVVLSEVPADATAVGVPARVVRVAGRTPASDLDQIHYTDPVSQDICRLQREIERLQKKLDMGGLENTDGGGI